MARISAIDGGTYYHHRSLYGERYRSFFDKIVYAPEIAETEFDRDGILIVSCRTDPSLLVPHRTKFSQYLEEGGTIVAMGSTGPHQWLPEVRWTDTPTNFWWWKEGDSLGLEILAVDHPLFDFIALDDATWHYHGFFAPPAGATSLIGAAGLGSVLYEDTTFGPGGMIITSLDPMYHYGSHFMPATTRFLDGFLPYLRSRLPGRSGVETRT